jgi:hypothetical protein
MDMKVVDRTGALLRFAVAVLLVLLGTGLAMGHFPGGFDWAYTVISKLASRTHNPAGGVWLSGALLLAMVVLWPVTTHLAGVRDAAGRRPRLAVAALRMGVAGGALLGLEGLFILDLSGVLRKGHELLALLTFLGLYGGVIGLFVHRQRRSGVSKWPLLLVVLPLLAVGVSQVALYFDQRDLGWVNTTWRDMGIPLWLSFAFWQWLAVAMLWIGLGVLVAAAGPRDLPLTGD